MILGSALLLGCAEGEHVAVVRASIVDGAVAEEDHAVVGIVAEEQLYCSGTLVAPHVVLTAAHCLPEGVTDVTIFSGTSWASGGWLIPATDVWVHPAYASGATGSDVGLLALPDAPSGALPLATTPPVVGDTMRIVGFGRIDADATSDDVRRSGTANVIAATDDDLILGADPSVTCGGDSGGPALLRVDGVEHVAGVHARGTCELEMTETRVDPFVADVEAFVAQHAPPSCEADGRCAWGCPSTDTDCPVAETVSPSEHGCAFGAGATPSAWPGWGILLGWMVRRRRCARRRRLLARCRSPRSVRLRRRRAP